MAARIFLYIIAFLVFLAVAAAIAWNVFQDELLRMAFVPSEPVEILDPVEESAYAAANMWLVRPDKDDAASDWLPEGYGEETSLTDAETTAEDDEAGTETPANVENPQEEMAEDRADLPRVPVFYVLPTTYVARDRWNAEMRDPSVRGRQELFAASQASVFNDVGEVWAPLYRQAVLGAFLTTSEEARMAIRFAYRDVEAAFDYFLEQIGPDQPFIIAGHSQGSLHLQTLLFERINGTPTADRIVAAYLIGWPISVEADLPALPLPGCVKADDAGCIYSYISFAEPADPRQVENLYEDSTGLTQDPRRGTDMLCINPLTGRRGGEAPASANSGSLIPNEETDGATLERERIPANCGDRGILMIGDPPVGYDSYVLPGNNYHVFDYMLFWANLRADVERRTRAYFEARG